MSGILNAAEVLGLFTRATNTCGVEGYTTCGLGLPSNFCCGPKTTCIAFNSGQSAICCPDGDTCDTILPVSCSLNFMNATAFPTNPLHSTNLTASLSTCGSNSCCPIGYSCQNSQCFLNNPNSATSQNNSTTSSSTGSSAAPTPISTANPTFTSASSIASISSTPTPLSGAAGSPSTSATASVHCDKFPATAIIAGFFPGLIIGILLTVLVLICLGRRKGTERMSGDFGHVRAQVSDPIYQGSSSIRTDFLRRTKSSAHVRSLFMRSPSTKFSNSSTPKTPSDQSPRTPESRIGLNAAAGPRRVPSMESIKIYSPPDGRLDQRQTTFTEMMENAGFRKGEPYLGSPGRVDPRTRHLTAGFGMK